MLSKQRLVGSDDMFSGAERRLDSGFGGTIFAADQLDEHVNSIVASEGNRIVKPAHLVEAKAAILSARPSRYRIDLERTRQDASETLAMGINEFQQAGADGTEPGNAEFERFGHLGILFA